MCSRELFSGIAFGITLVAAVACAPSADPYGEAAFFVLDGEESERFAGSMAELDKLSAESQELRLKIWGLPPVSGRAAQDAEIVAALHDLALDVLSIEEKATSLFLSVIGIEKEAYLRLKDAGDRRLLHPRYERDLIRLKDQRALEHLRSVNAEYAELRKKLGYQLLGGDGSGEPRPLSDGFFFALDGEAEGRIRELVSEIRASAKDNDGLTEQIRGAADLKELPPLVLRGIELEERIASAFLEGVSLLKTAYVLQREEGNGGGKKVLTPEQELLFISVKNEMIDSNLRSGNREFDEFLKKVGLL